MPTSTRISQLSGPQKQTVGIQRHAYKDTHAETKLERERERERCKEGGIRCSKGKELWNKILCGQVFFFSNSACVSVAFSACQGKEWNAETTWQRENWLRSSRDNLLPAELDCKLSWKKKKTFQQWFLFDLGKSSLFCCVAQLCSSYFLLLLLL